MTADLDKLALESTIKRHFGPVFDVKSIILAQADVSRTARATVFLTKKKQLMLYLTASANLKLADVKKIVARMGLRAELYFPPKGRPHYFDDIGRERFLAVFPGRQHVSGDDLRFYRTLAPYNPSLVLVSEVKNGEIYQFDPDAHGQWRVGAKFAYRRIKTS